jgi:hypothetical protein
MAATAAMDGGELKELRIGRGQLPGVVVEPGSNVFCVESIAYSVI